MCEHVYHPFNTLKVNIYYIFQSIYKRVLQQNRFYYSLTRSTYHVLHSGATEFVMKLKYGRISVQILSATHRLAFGIACIQQFWHSTSWKKFMEFIQITETLVVLLELVYLNRQLPWPCSWRCQSCSTTGHVLSFGNNYNLIIWKSDKTC